MEGLQYSKPLLAKERNPNLQRVICCTRIGFVQTCASFDMIFFACLSKIEHAQSRWKITQFCSPHKQKSIGVWFEERIDGCSENKARGFTYIIA